jgi:hypothetical protein
MKRILFLLLVMMVVMPLGAEESAELHPVRLGKKFGFVDKKGTLVLPADLDWAWPLTEGRAGVRRGKEWFLIDDQGSAGPKVGLYRPRRRLED